MVRFPRSGLTAASSITMMLLALLAGQAAAQQDTDVLPTFEVASIRMRPPGEQLTFVNIPGVRVFPGGRLTALKTPIALLVQFAYGLQYFELSDTLPEALGKAAFDINALAGREAPSVPRGEVGTMNLMMRALLRDRFKVVVRREEREENVSVLTRVSPDRLGPGLQRASAPCAVANPRGLLFSETGQQCWGTFSNNGHVVVTGLPIREFARQLETYLGGSVIDRTGLDGVFDFTMTFNYMDLPALSPLQAQIQSRTGKPVPGSDSPDLSTALREQLGLRMSRERATVTRWVLERAEMPTEN
jgi:uncharacterized protein (TIGR03435 family)